MLQQSGTMRASHIRQEFNSGSGIFRFSNFYRSPGGSAVSNIIPNQNISSSSGSRIKFSNFYKAVKWTGILTLVNHQNETPSTYATTNDGYITLNISSPNTTGIQYVDGATYNIGPDVSFTLGSFSSDQSRTITASDSYGNSWSIVGSVGYGSDSGFAVTYAGQSMTTNGSTLSLAWNSVSY